MLKINMRRKVLGQNARNLHYIKGYNSKSALTLAGDKILSKRFLEKHKIPTPKLIGIIENFDDFNKFDWESLPNSFVLKPAGGLEGKGIHIFYNKDNEGNWIRADGTKVDLETLKSYVSDILEGRYASGFSDKVFFEERVKIHKAFRYHTYKGAPDVRIWVFNNIPIIAYLRLPTKQSEGKANMAKGAIAAGIDMATGRTTTATLGKARGGRGYPVEYVPGTKLRLSGLQIPFWNRMLKSAIEIQRNSNLGFVAVDFLIDRDLGPLVVELTARPGLSIQITNRDGVKWRLEKVAGLKVSSVEKGILLAKELFGGEIEEEIEGITGKQVIGLIERVKLIGPNGKERTVLAKIDTGADSTSIDEELARDLGYGEIINDVEAEKYVKDSTFEYRDKLTDKLKEKYILKYPDYFDTVKFIKSSHGMSLRPFVKIKLIISEDFQFETITNIYDRGNLDYQMIIGRKSLTQFLIDPTKKYTTISK